MTDENDADDRISALLAERKRVRDDVYSLGTRVSAGETSLRQQLEAAIARSDAIDAEIARLTPLPPRPEGPPQSMAMYGPPPVPGPLGLLSRLFRRK